MKRQPHNSREWAALLVAGKARLDDVPAERRTNVVWHIRAMAEHLKNWRPTLGVKRHG